MHMSPNASPHAASPESGSEARPADGASDTSGTVTSSSLSGHTAVFRVRDSQSPQTSAQAPERGSGKAVYHPRKPHRKSRTGCPNCKKRRVKVLSSLSHQSWLFYNGLTLRDSVTKLDQVARNAKPMVSPVTTSLPRPNQGSGKSRWTKRRTMRSSKGLLNYPRQIRQCTR